MEVGRHPNLPTAQVPRLGEREEVRLGSATCRQLQVRADPQQHDIADENEAPRGRPNGSDEHSVYTDRKAADAAEQVQHDTALHPVHTDYFFTLIGCWLWLSCLDLAAAACADLAASFCF